MSTDQHWCEQPLYRFVVEILPTFRSPFNRLDVPKLSDSIGMSRQGIYRWFQVGKLTPKNARRLHQLANEQANVEALGKLDRQPPHHRDFDQFVYGD